MNREKGQSNRKALLWSGIETFGHQIVQLLTYIVLARLVSPTEFGFLAMLGLFLALGECLADSGFSNALIQKQNDDDIDRSTVFYINLFTGLVLSGVLFVASPLIAQFYDEPALEKLGKVMSLVVVVHSLGLVQDAMTRKRLDFQIRAKIAVTASFVAAVVSIPMALAEAGVWALAAHTITLRSTQTIMLWILCPWRPIAAFSLSRLRNMFQYGSRLMIAGILNAFFGNLYALAIGKTYSAVEVGYYSNAKRYQEYPANNITRIFGRFSFPAFSREQDNTLAMGNVFKKTLLLSSYAVFPIMALLCGVARPLFEVVLGPAWLPSVPLFQLLCIAGIFQPIAAINLNILLAMGKSGQFLGLEVAKKLLSVLSLVITLKFGLFWIVAGETIVVSLAFFVNTFFTERYIGISINQQLRLVTRAAAFSVIVGIISYSATLVPASPLWQTCIGLLSGIAVGMVLMVLLDRRTLQLVWKTLLDFKSPTPGSGQ